MQILKWKWKLSIVNTMQNKNVIILEVNVASEKQ